MSKKTEKLEKTGVLPANPDVSHISVGTTTLEQALQRAQKILRTYTGDAALRGYLQAAGFGAEVYDEGWQLLRRAYGEREQAPQAPPTPSVLGVIDRLEAETSSVFGRVRAVLHRFYPAQEAFVFDGLNAASGFESVIALQTLLDRIDELDRGTSKGTQKQDRAAVAALQLRGVDPELRDELRKLCATVESAPVSVKPPPVSPAEPAAKDEREARLLELYAWVQDWSETARCVVPDKRLLRRMGIGKRKARASKGTPVIVPPQAPAPAPQAPAPNGAMTMSHA